MRALIVAAVLLAGVAHAKETEKVASVRVVIAPFTALTEGNKVAAALQTLVGDGLATLPNREVVPDKELRAAVKKAGKRELELCEGDAHCLSELGKLVGAQVVVAGEVSELGEGQVAYLKAVDVKSEKEIGSTTAVFGAAAADARKAESKAAAYRLLAPREYVGTLKLAIDAPGATVYLDGRKVAKSPAGPLVVAVGTHALRVTHEQYRDFVRFVDVKFDETTTLDVPMTAFPVVTDEMRQKEAQRRAGPTEPLPWYRKWYTVAGVGVGAVVITAVVVSLVAGSIDSDREVTVGQ
jgi:hypothetical protein